MSLGSFFFFSSLFPSLHTERQQSQCKDFGSSCRKNEEHGENSYDFVESIADIEIQDDETMISYDVEALYTSLPIDSVLEIVRQKLKHKCLP